MMRKVKINPAPLLLPLPAVLVGCRHGKDISFAAIAWAGIVNSEPPMLGVGIRRSRFTHELISKAGAFSVNVPTADLAVETDFCGITSGRDVDKAAVCGFTLFYGETEGAPLIEECPLNLGCTVERVIKLPSHDYFIGRITEVHMNEELVGGDAHDFEKLRPLAYMRTHYAAAEGNLGRTFSIGRQLKK
jgi:flavin reductase (DIM6/NTAB) family NADH-FMN oxidoreductase RutF